MKDEEEVIGRVLREAKTVAVVGLSSDPSKPSAYVAAYLQQAGYRIIPVNPTAERLLGERVYPALEDVDQPVDLVDVFRPPAACAEVARQAVAIGAKAIWLQSGIISEEAAEIARAGGLEVIMDRCTMVEHRRRQ